MSNKILEVKDLESWYGKVQILHKVNIHLDKGEIVCIIGPNGCGKSTLLKNIFGLIEKNKGKVMLEGHNITDKSPNEIVKSGISFVPQGRSVFPSLTVQENLEMGAYIREEKIEKDIKDLYKMFPILKERRKQKAGLLSGGEQQIVSIARSLMLEPKVLLLDEPSLGLSPQLKKMIFEKIKEINKMGISMIIVEQNAMIALEMCDRAYVLELGKNKYHGTGKELLKDKRIQKLYLGGA